MKAKQQLTMDSKQERRDGRAQHIKCQRRIADDAVPTDSLLSYSSCWTMMILLVLHAPLPATCSTAIGNWIVYVSERTRERGCGERAEFSLLELSLCVCRCRLNLFCRALYVMLCEKERGPSFRSFIPPRTLAPLDESLLERTFDRIAALFELSPLFQIFLFREHLGLISHTAKKRKIRIKEKTYREAFD
ncbi:hypothetical protein OUZ56_019226 [Daphnia magna]|uniref:Uncharacterized protein n=1 Tax=Daphnia magna TaxID=35525 RepID=A0ABQ9ZAZ9_9CRUS|nr:hypothetical protein OUZ56_019226 [Daphnia magna]